MSRKNVRVRAGGAAPVSPDNIIWSGDFDDGNLLKWNAYAPGAMELWGIPLYGMPPAYSESMHAWHRGNGDLMWLNAAVEGDGYKQGPILPGTSHSLGLHVKSNAGGAFAGPGRTRDTVHCAANPSECVNGNIIGDWDGNTNETRRRSELRGYAMIQEAYYIPKETTRWASCSIFIPADWDDGGSSWGPSLWNFKSTPGADMSAPIEVAIESGKSGQPPGGRWQIFVRRSNGLDQGGYVTADWPGAIRFAGYSMPSHVFYPNDAASVAALNNINKGGWTHFVMQMHFDGRTSTEGGQGFLKLWMRAGTGAWVHVLDVYADTEYGVTHPQSAEGRWGLTVAMYMHDNAILGLTSAGRTAHYSNIKIANNDGTFNSIFAQMSHDGSAP